MKNSFSKKLNVFLLLITLTVFAFSCQSNSSDATNTNNSDSDDHSQSTSESTPAKPLESKDLVYAWVDKLNIRDAANTKGKAITAVQSDDALEFTGERSGKSEEIVLRGLVYDETWLKVITPDKKEGWVFGGAVKKKEEKKGNAPISDTQFDFPHFGNFDLSSWKKLGTKTEGEEVDIEITTYQKGSQTLEITQSERGEFYYGYTHKLMDANKKIIKQREFSFSVDTDLRDLTETVKDYTTNPPTQFQRKQKLKKHFYDLNARPQMVNGTWTESTLKAVAPPVTTSKVSLQTFEFDECTKLVQKEFSCSCSFGTDDYYKGPSTFVSNSEKSACIKVDGQLNALYPDWESRDYKAELKKLAESKVWITVKNSGVLYFGKPLEDYKYEDAIEFLTDVILASGKEIKEIPIQNTAEGMAIREIRDSANDAIANAKTYKSKGGDDPLYIVKMDNKSYDVFVRYRQITQYEGEANKFDGKITLLPSREKYILDTKVIKGNCGC